MQHFANYELVRRIAVGGMGEVFLARQRTAFGREVAVKIIRPDLMYNTVARKRFQREAEVSSYLQHDYILPMLEFNEEQGRLFIVTPYIKGGTLAQRLEQGPLILSDVQHIFSSLLKAVAYLHKHGIIHRDLKPGNILLDKPEDGDRVRVRLIDFGIAAIQGQVDEPPNNPDGQQLGTEAYMAPERFNGVVAVSNDIYSLGVILYLMLTGHFPKDERREPLPRVLETVIERCLAEDPTERFATVEELLRSFDLACRSLSGQLRTNNVLPPKISSPEHQLNTPTKLNSQEHAAVPVANNTLSPRRVTNEPTVKRSKSGEMKSQVDFSTPPPPREVRLPPLPGKNRLSGVEFDAPTSLVSMGSINDQKLRADATTNSMTRLPKKGKAKKKGGVSPLLIVSLLIIIVIGAIGGIGFVAFQSSASATVSIEPKVQPVREVFTMKAKPGVKSIDAANSVIPANVFTSAKKGSLSGGTTGRSGCVLGIFECKQSVSFVDVSTLSAQLRPNLRTQIEQDLRKQATNSGATLVGNIFFAEGEVSANPPVGTVSKTVTVTSNEQGSVEYIKSKDANDLAIQLLRKKVAKNYQLIDASMKIGQPIVRGVSANGEVTIEIAAAAMSRYQFSSTELVTLQNQIKGKTIKEARELLSKQPNINPNTIAIRLSYGETIPDNVGQITLTTLNPTSIGDVTLPKVSSTPTPSR